MSGLGKKRSRESETVVNSTSSEDNECAETKRFHGLTGGETNHQFLHLLEDMDSVENSLEEDHTPADEELVYGVMRSLEQEIGVAKSSTSSEESQYVLSRDNSVVSDVSSDQSHGFDYGVDLGYLLEASDDELGIPPSPILDLKDQVCCSKDSSLPELSELQNVCLDGNWHFEDEFANYNLYEFGDALMDANQLQEYTMREFISPSEGDYSVPWRLETAGGMYS
eukprot:Gb_16121 [translate_table: standard]